MFSLNSHRVYSKWRHPQFYHATKEAELPRVTPHSLRHSLNSALLLAAISPYLIRLYLGWLNTSSMLTRQCEEGYTHASVDNLRLIAEKIDELLYRPRAADNQKKIFVISTFM